MSRLGSIGANLYTGHVSYDFVGLRKRWYIISGVVLLISVISLLTLRFTLGIEFRGGAEFRVTSPTVSVSSVEKVVAQTDSRQIIVQGVGNNTVRAQTEKLTTDQSEKIRADLAKRFGVKVSDVSTQFVGPSWGRDISSKALQALIFFLIGVMIFLALYFEWKMALAAMIALVHDLIVTAGVYSLVGFEVTPATVIGFLTILGYSLYDTVVVFDKVRENTAGLAGGSRMTYSQSANLAVNQTLVRSINTSVIALLPIGSILFAGIALLGSGPLKDLALALFVGVATGAYSSIFIATPLLATFKEKEPAMQALAKRVAARQSGAATATVRKPVTGRRSRAAAAARPDDVDGDVDQRDQVDPYAHVATDEESIEPATAGAAARTTGEARASARPEPRPAAGAQRSQPRRNTKGRPGGKKRR